ncbi:hypothetical protein ACLD0U_07685 [Microbacterium sp. 2216-1]|uniref:hypothetical protein n=1 Tax=Microbacterium sp. 2216-1 TaxID=3390053 RepID=UPI00397482F6
MSHDTTNLPPSDGPLAGVPAALGDSERVEDVDGAVLYEDQVQPETGIFGFTLRELLIIGTWFVAFVVSFFPVGIVGGSIWTTGIGWILTIGVPTVAVFLVVLRRLSPDGIRRVGSLGIDQFASVAASVAAVSWAQLLWSQVAVTIGTGVYAVGWVVIVAQLALAGMVVVTVFAPLIPGLREDFEGRMETLAHRNANPVRPVVARAPRVRSMNTADAADAGEPAVENAAVEDEAIAEPEATAGEVDAADTPAREADSLDATRSLHIDGSDQLAASDETPTTASDDTEVPFDEVPQADHQKDHHTDPVGVLEQIFADDVETTVDRPFTGAAGAGTTAGAAPGPVGAEPFWVLAATERDVLDERGHTLFRVGPHAWTLVIEDRGGAYVVRHEDGRIGYLHDITDITRG